MTIRNLPIAATILFSLLCASAGPAQQPGNEPTKSTSCLIRIRFESPATPLGTEALEYLVNSPGVFDAAFRSVSTGPTARGAHTLAKFQDERRRESDDTTEIEGKLSVHLSDSDAAAVNEGRLLNAVVEKLRKSLAQVPEEAARRLVARRQTITERQAQLASQRDALRGQQTRLLQEAGAPVSPLELEKTLITLNDKNRELELTLVGQRARQEAISKAIAELTTHIQERAASDPVVTELQQVVEIRARILERTRARAASHTITPQEVDQSVETVALARAELAKARAAAAMNAGGEQIARLNSELTNLSIDAAEIRARAELLSRQTEELRSGAAMKNAVEYERLAAQLRDLESALGSAAEQVAKLDQQVRRFEAPTLTVIGQ